MIKELPKKTKKSKTLLQIVLEYIRTIMLSFFAALIFTTLLSIHARSEMIRNLYESISEQEQLDRKMAQQIVAQSDLLETLSTKNYAICMQVGNLYETAGDYKKAQYAYELAIERAKHGNYKPYQKLAISLIEQEKFNEAEDVINYVEDIRDSKLIKFKTRTYIVMGDKYYSIGKFISAAKSYEKAKYYYDRFDKKDPIIEESIINRIVNSYSEAAGVMVKNDYNSEAVKYLRKALVYSPDNNKIKYKLAIIYSDLDPVQSVEYFDYLLEKMPQNIDYTTYNKSLIKAANIADITGDSIKSKQYRYRIHTIDMFINQKVVYKNDIETILSSFVINKFLFKYHLKGVYRFRNLSNSDIKNLSADFVLKQGNRVKETVTLKLVDPKNKLRQGEETKDFEIKFGKNIFTHKEIEQYTVNIYLYKDERYKTLVFSFKVPEKTIKFNE